MKTLTFILLAFLPFISFSQNCNCKTNFNWVRTTFEDNDAGFQYIIDKKGSQAYQIHNSMFESKLMDVEDVFECQQLINAWFKFFRKGHVGLEYIGKRDQSNQTIEQIESVASTTIENWETYPINIETFKSYLENKTKHDLEGVWSTGYYKIGIKREGKDYIGFITESSVQEWEPQQVKLKITSKSDHLESIFYMFDRSGVKSNHVNLLDNNYLQIGKIILTRSYPLIKNESQYRLHFKALNSHWPFIEELNETTLYFRIPSFSGTVEKNAIDSVIIANKSKILSSENLIIDIRNGTGGDDFSYSEIIPLLYTNPIRMPQVEFRSTVLNNKRSLDFSKNDGFSKEIGVDFTKDQQLKYSKAYRKLSKNLGKFVNIDSTDVMITNYDTILPYPQNVGIIQNQNNASTDEQFLLEARQSKKVKLFGRTSAGALDISNLYRAKSPCGEFILWYALSRSLRIPDMVIDDIGIQPDYYIDNQIPETEWIKYVSNILNGDKRDYNKTSKNSN